MHFKLLSDKEGVSLERINYDLPSDDPDNWHSASEEVGFATPAYINSQFTDAINVEDETIKIEPKVFSPDNDGFDDFVNISYKFDEPGHVANIYIYDSKGRLIRHLTNNRFLSPEGVIIWDGLNGNNEKVRAGIYILYLEIFDLNGNVKKYKKTVVCATKF